MIARESCLLSGKIWKNLKFLEIFLLKKVKAFTKEILSKFRERLSKLSLQRFCFDFASNKIKTIFLYQVLYKCKNFK